MRLFANDVMSRIPSRIDGGRAWGEDRDQDALAFLEWQETAPQEGVPSATKVLEQAIPCENTRKLLQRFLNGEVSQADLANALKRHPANVGRIIAREFKKARTRAQLRTTC